MILALVAHLACWAEVVVPVIDFSCAGYGGGGEPLPSPRAVLRVKPCGGDDTAMLQAAIDKLASLPLAGDGFRGALLFEPGRYPISGQLRLGAGGVVLRGASGKSPATLVATGTGRRALIELGASNRPALGLPVGVTDTLVPAGEMRLRVDSVAGFNPGDRVVVTRPCTGAWVASLAQAGSAGGVRGGKGVWLPGSRELHWTRRVVAVEPASRQLTLDAPITTALEIRFGGATVARVVARPPAERMGVENLVLESAFDSRNPRDEEHAWFAIHMEDVEDAFVREVTARHFVSSAVHVGNRARRVSIQHCRCEQPVSELGSYRRQAFWVEGQQVLVAGCRSEDGMQDFSLGFCAAGPNVFLDCEAVRPLGASGTYESSAAGALFERVRIEGAPLRLAFESGRTPGAGWTAANCAAWNCQASEIVAQGPEQAPNLVSNSPQPLYETQLKARGKTFSLTACSLDNSRPAWFRQSHSAAKPPEPERHPFAVVGGRFVVDGKALWGPVLNEGWWRGSTVPSEAQKNGGISASRFMPGRTGFGLTEDLEAVGAVMAEKRVPFYVAIPGLWYDRRRDQHTTFAQTNGEVLAPFLEYPWARSGQGTAADGLSKFDLTRFNDWYFERYRQMARIASRRGFVMVQHLYDTHDVLEILPHWADYPFRPLNNINGTDTAGISEPPALDRGRASGSKNFHQANEVYNVDQPLLRDLHRRLILHTLDVLGDEPNVIFSLSFQFVGPLRFQQFFFDTVAEWEQARHRSVKLALITTRDITDSILADPARARHVVMLDTRYWQYRPDGSLFAPEGGRNRAFRESVQQTFPGSSDHPPPTTPAMAYRQVREYRDRYPGLAVCAWNNGVGQIPGLMAGASLVMMNSPFGGHNQMPGEDRTRLDEFVQDQLAPVLMSLSPADAVAELVAAGEPTVSTNSQPLPRAAWTLADKSLRHILVYAEAGTAVKLGKLPASVAYRGIWFEPGSGHQHPAQLPARVDGSLCSSPASGPALFYLSAD
jgi:hypothetical protein